VNDFEEIQKIYEEGYRGQQFDPVKPPNAYPARQDWGPYSRPIPGSPESSGYSMYQQNMVGNGIAQVIDEEIPAVEIINLDVIEKIDELLDEAEDEEMTYAVLQLSRLKEHIISLSR
jgi:hypothetical protein|tara:strand:+ start:1384 stop:1734 length:351 start_codon:yes stop_codon:yes gene_type:complete